MSRVGRLPIKVPEKVKARVEGRTVFVEGPKGKLNFLLPEKIDAQIADHKIVFKRSSDEQEIAARHGMVRAIVNNMVVGVSDGFSKILEIVGVGYKAEAKGRELVLQLGFSHPVNFPLPEGIEVKVDKQTRITLSGCDKQLLGEVAAEIRGIRPPEPYKGKGIRYAGEVVKQKVGKAAIATSG